MNRTDQQNSKRSEWALIASKAFAPEPPREQQFPNSSRRFAISWPSDATAVLNEFGNCGGIGTLLLGLTIRNFPPLQQQASDSQ
ncbi:hypothetical protein [Jiella mangrovi]|uniref:hypothetical protein n=1 Tax=Jiella mangrovi TaxID=2821407 RepID=UPI001AE824F8|nr:hypothetical protein [Jiella mangrovi]